ncbi:MAG TPA: BON domain-containing protein [Steroidobacteraceae bacterium]|nr:BON domain-containing protein [Steroidobacteraceae bacterium]
MGLRDFFRGHREQGHDRWHEDWRDNRYPKHYSSDSRGRSERAPDRQRGPQVYGQSGRSDWPDPRAYSRDQGGAYARGYDERPRRDWIADSDREREPYHGGFYAGETGRESLYRTEPSAQGDWGRDSERWQEQRETSDRQRFESREQGEHRGRGPRSYQRSDARIREDACECLTDDHFIDASDIEVNVQNGIVTLSGTVQSRTEKRRAEDLIDQLSGVRDVNNSLVVDGASQRSAGSDAVNASAVQPAAQQRAPSDNARH